MDAFGRQKSHAVNRLRASIKVGDVDADMLPLLEFINSLPDYYSTSSCAGRITLLLDLGSKKENFFVGCWHSGVSFAEVKEAVGGVKKPGGVVWLKSEPAIVHVVARTLEGARKMLVLGRESGFKKTGIQSVKPDRFMVEIGGTEVMEAPLVDGKKMLVSDGYLRYLVKTANKKHARGRSRLKRLHVNLKKTLK